MSLIPFFCPAAQLTTLTMQDSATSLTHQITGPASILPGDLLVHFSLGGNSGSPAPAAAALSGFTIITNHVNGTNVGRYVSGYKIADGSEASATLSGMNGTAADYICLYVFRGNIPITSATVGFSSSDTTDGNVNAINITAGSGTPPLIVFAGYGVAGGATINPRTFSTTKDGEINPNVSHYLAYKIYNTSPADTSVDMDDEGSSNMLHGWYIRCS